MTTTVETTRLVWLPGRAARSVTAQWRGVDWNYTLYWGDGTSEHVPQVDGGRGHTYAEPGTYKVVAVSTVHSTYTASVQVTVRSWAKPPVPGSSLTNNVVTLTMPDVPDPVRWSVGWGDGTITVHERGTEVSHTYPWGFGTPEITVWDDPSARQVTFAGPHIGPEPVPPGNLTGWVWDYTGYDRRFVLYGGGIDPHTEVHWSDWSFNQVRTATADENGTVTIVYDIPQPIYSDWDVWRSYTVQHQQHGETVTRFVPVHVPSAQAGTAELVYDLDETDPQRLTFSALPAVTGTHRLDPGDGSGEQVVSVTDLPMRLTHTYPAGGSSYTARLTMPDGRTASRRITAGNPYPCDPEFNPNYPGRASLIWWFPGKNCGRKMRDPFDPVVTQVTGHTPHRHHCPDEDGFNAGYGYRFTSTGWKAFNLLTPLTKWRHTGVSIDKLDRVKTAERGYELQLGDDEAELTAWFGNVTEWDGGYRGDFHVTNHTGQEVTRWHVEFSLSDPAVLRDAWPRAEVVDLGRGRWRISSNTRIPAGTDATVTARVEPPGKTRRFPDEITAGAG